MIDSLLKLVLVLLVTSTPLLLAWGMCKLVVRSERKEWKKKFDAIHRGDKYIQWLDNDNPFKRQYGQVVEITGKASVCDKRFYLEYKIGEAPVAIYDSCSIQDFFDVYHYIPYTYQDEQS
jgi:hypothetical protein